MEPTISVIVPIYNIEKTLRKCLDSICSQTYSNIEIILVDDGSEDNSLSICNEYAKKDERIIVFHQENKGLSGARNSGIKLAKGKYIGVVDSDDYIDKTMYEKLLNSIETENADVAIGNYVFINEEGKRLSESAVIKNEVLTGIEALKKLQSSGRVYYITAWNKLYRREIFQDVEFPEGKINEDVFVVHRIFDKCSKISTISDVVYFYVQRKNSIMNREITVSRLDIFEALYNRYKFYKHRDFGELLSSLFHIIEEEYYIREKVACTSKGDKRRIKEIDRIIWEMYHDICNRKNIKKHIKFKFPKLYLKALDIYKGKKSEN